VTGAAALRGLRAPLTRRRSRSQVRVIAPPLEHRIMLTAALCLLAYGAVMVYSASSPIGVLSSNGQGYGTGEFVEYLFAGAIGLVVMKVLERRGLALLRGPVVKLLLLVAVVLLLLVMVPGFGLKVAGARRWFAVGPIQFQPSELMKLALVLFVAQHLAENPKRLQRGFREAVAPIVIVAGPSCLLIAAEPDIGTTLVVALTVTALMVAGGMPMRHIGVLLAIAVGLGAVFLAAEPYQRSRLLAFLHPGCHSSACYQASQGQIALGSGGLFGVGLGKAAPFYVPEAQTDFILALVGEELGVAGVFVVIVLYGMIAYAGLRTARRAATRYGKLLATGLTSLILCQGILNIFVVLGIAPLTGVPLPFMSYAPTNLCVMLASIGLLLNISRPGARRLRALDGEDAPVRARGREPAADRDRRGRNSGARRAGAGGSRRAAS
jgi:cell division protein FtsW